MNPEVQKVVKELISSLEHGCHVSVGEAARRLDCSSDYLKRHLDMFPNAWRLPAGRKPKQPGHTGRQTGEIRIPVKDIEQAISKRKIHKQNFEPCSSQTQT